MRSYESTTKTWKRKLFKGGINKDFIRRTATVQCSDFFKLCITITTNQKKVSKMDELWNASVLYCCNGNREQSPRGPKSYEEVFKEAH